MKKPIVFITLILMAQTINSQIHELGVFFGGSNFVGDVGATNYIAPNEPAIGLIYKWNRSPRHSFRFSALFTDLEGIDAESDDPRRILRDYSFNNNIMELSLGMEFTFFDFNLHEFGWKATPYLYSGITYTTFDNYYFNENGAHTPENSKNKTFGIPMVLGFKTNLTEHLIFAIELGARYTFTDNLDGSVPESETLKPFSFGNINNYDWYMFSGITLTYTFVRKPCYCNY